MKKDILILFTILLGLSFSGCAKKVDIAQQRYEYNRANVAATQAHQELNKE